MNMKINKKESMAKRETRLEKIMRYEKDFCSKYQDVDQVCKPI